MLKERKFIKFIFTTIIIFIISTGSFSQLNILQASLPQSESNFVDIASAIIIANNKLNQHNKLDYNIDYIDKIKNHDGTLLFYVFHLSPVGYVVISGNKNLPPVLAYSFLSPFKNKLNGDNVLKEMLISDVLLRLENINIFPNSVNTKRDTQWSMYLSSNNKDIKNIEFEQWPKVGATSTGGWLETEWSQDEPYNNFCPIDKISGLKSIAGCPAVAMAQILNYHETINNIQLNDSDDYLHNYGGNYYWIDDDYLEYDFPSFPDLNNYLDMLVDHWRNDIELTDNDKASINFACGVAAKQVYHPNGSGTFGVNQAFDAYHRFNFDEIELVDESDEDLYDRLNENIINALPAHLAIVNEEFNKGHNLVVDGYNTEGFYHLNFGWGGYYDGWYSLPDELPYELTVIEGIILNITNENSGSNLNANGYLQWSDVKSNSIVTGNFSIENIGLPGSEIDWEVVVWPEWGTWTFTPTFGDNLKPEDGCINISVKVEIQKSIKNYFNGHIKIVNKDNLDDYCIVHVSLTKSHYKYFIFTPLMQFLISFLNICIY